jgi:5,10-methylenetetrahydromethanopterin reductase
MSQAHRIGIGSIPKHYADYPTFARTAEQCGFDALSTGDSSTLWTDPFVTMAVAASVTERIGLSIVGSNPVTRHPVAAAAAMESIQLFSGGRFSYALGSGDSAVANIGRPRARLAEVEDYCRAVRDLTAGRTARFQERDLQLTWGAAAVPVLLCAEGPKTQELAGRVADGAVLYNGLTADVVTASLDRVRRGAEAAGRSLEELDLWWPVVFHLCEDAAEGLEAVTFSLAGTANRAFRHSLEDKLVPEPLRDGFRGLQSEYRSNRHQQLDDHAFNASLVAKYGLTTYLAERFAVVGPPEYCVERLLELFSFGVRHVSLSLLSQDLPSQLATMRHVADQVLPHLV